MPTYEYQCLPNGHRFEVRHGMNESPIQTCSVCGAAVRRVIHPVGIVFKGSGFYVNDSRKTSSTVKPAESSGTESPAAAKTDSGTTSTSESSSGESKDSKPAKAAKEAPAAS